MPMVPPIAETAVPTIAAATSPSTLRSRPSLKPGPKYALDEPGRQHGFAGIAHGEENGAPEIAVAEQIGHDGCRHRADDDRPARARPERDQDAGRDTGGGPEHGHAFRLGQQRKAQARGQEIGDADRDGEPDQADPPRQVDAGGQRVTLNRLSQVSAAPPCSFPARSVLAQDRDRAATLAIELNQRSNVRFPVAHRGRA